MTFAVRATDHQSRPDSRQRAGDVVNRALILSIAKVDHVRNSVFLGALAEQLKEEQAHNQLWREKLRRFGVDHEKLYSDLESYRARFTASELDAMTAKTLAAVTDD